MDVNFSEQVAHRRDDYHILIMVGKAILCVKNRILYNECLFIKIRAVKRYDFLYVLDIIFTPIHSIASYFYDVMTEITLEDHHFPRRCFHFP